MGAYFYIKMEPEKNNHAFFSSSFLFTGLFNLLWIDIKNIIISNFNNVYKKCG